MEKKTMLLMAAGAIAAGAVVYYISRKRKTGGGHRGMNHKKDKHLTQVFSKAKGYAGGEYTL